MADRRPAGSLAGAIGQAEVSGTPLGLCVASTDRRQFRFPASRCVCLVDYEVLSAFAGRHPLLSSGLVVLTIAIIGNELSPLFRGYGALRPAEVTALVNRDNALLVDLRPYADFQKGHIAGSKNVLMSQFDPESKLLTPAKALPIVMVCQSGVTAGPAARRLKKAGFTQVHILDGGILAWQQADLPLVKGRG